MPDTVINYTLRAWEVLTVAGIIAAAAWRQPAGLSGTTHPGSNPCRAEGCGVARALQ